VTLSSLTLQLELPRDDDEVRGPGTPKTRIRGVRLVQGVRRLLGSVGVVLSVVTATFLVTRVFAPDPTDLFLSPGGNGFASAAAEAAERAKVDCPGFGGGSPAWSIGLPALL
jgi:hypothetical protein